MKFKPSLVFATSFLLGACPLVHAQTTPPGPTSYTKKVHTPAPELEVPRGSIWAYSPNEWLRNKDLPQYKEFEAWVNVGARTDGPTPGPDDPPPGTWSYYSKPFRGVYGPVWDFTMSGLDWLGATETRTGTFGIYTDGHAPGAGEAFQSFWEGNLNASVGANWKNGDPVYNPAKYTWSGIGDVKLYVPSNSTAAEREVRTFEGSTASKDFHIDFGDTSPESLQNFPQTTAVNAVISDPNHPEKPPIGPMSAVVTWHIRPVTLYRLKIKYEIYEDGVPIDISQQIYDIVNAKTQVVKTGAQLTKEAINALYIQPAEGLITGPLMAAGFHGIANVVKAGATWFSKVAEDIRIAKAAELGVDASRISVNYTVTVERVSNAGTVTRDAAAADSAATSAEATSAFAKAASARQDAANALSKLDETIVVAEQQEQALRQAGKVSEADAIHNQITSMKAARSQAASDLADGNSSFQSAQDALPTLAQISPTLAQGARKGNYYAKIGDASNLARTIGEGIDDSGGYAKLALAGALDAAASGEEASRILRAAGFNDAQIAAATNALKTLAQNKIPNADSAQTSGRTLYSRNTNQIVRVGVAGRQCFTAGTLVSTEKGLECIERLKTGDLVWSRNEATGRTELKPIVRLFQHQSPATLLLTFSNGERIETTKTHPFYVESQGFVPAGELGIGTSIVTRAGPAVQLVSSQIVSTAQTVFNFEVKDFHTYFVGKSQIWVHNQCVTFDDNFFSHVLGQGVRINGRIHVYSAKMDKHGNVNGGIKGVHNYSWLKQFYFPVVNVLSDVEFSPGFRRVIYDGTPIYSPDGKLITGYDHTLACTKTCFDPNIISANKYIDMVIESAIEANAAGRYRPNPDGTFANNVMVGYAKSPANGQMIKFEIILNPAKQIVTAYPVP